MTSVMLDRDQLKTLVHQALRGWNSPSGGPGEQLSALLLVQEQRRALGPEPVALRLATNQVLTESVDLLAQQDELSARVLRLRFFEDEITLMVAQRIGRGEDQTKRLQRKAIDQLTQVLWERENALREQRIQEIEAALGTQTNRHLFGIEAALTSLTAELLRPDTPWVVLISGIGGIGKSTLADALVRQVIPHFYFEQVAWLQIDRQPPAPGRVDEATIYENVMAQLAARFCPYLQPGLPAGERNLHIRQTLKAAPHLIVIDDLEAKEETDSLLASLHDLASPSKFLLTSRFRPPGRDGTFSYTLTELHPATAAQLIRHHAQDTGATELAAISDTAAQTIYNTIGGNPLALKLVVSLAASLPLPQILDDFIEVNTRDVQDIYRHIYWKTWHSLSPAGQQLLEIMHLAAPIGVTPDEMAIMAGLDKADLLPAIAELVHRSLLDVRGSPWDRRYAIHALTRAFLQTEIIHWPEDLV